MKVDDDSISRSRGVLPLPTIRQSAFLLALEIVRSRESQLLDFPVHKTKQKDPHHLRDPVDN